MDLKGRGPMVFIKVEQLKPGDKLLDDVLTPLGSTLLLKEKVITERDIDILVAFMVKKVEIVNSTEHSPNQDDVETKQNANQSAKQEQTVVSFNSEYEKMVEMLKQLSHLVLANQSLPLMDIRKQLSSIFEHIGDYNPITFAPAFHSNKDYFYHKSVLTSLTSHLMAQWVGMPQKDWMQVALAGLLMDIGNLKIDPIILSKPDKLTDEENRIVQRHTYYGYQILRSITALNEGVKLAALQHHERVDSSGYPNGLNGNQLHPYSKIVAIADIYHAMTLNKVYRKPLSPYLVLEQIQSDAFGKLEPIYVRTFIEKVAKFNVGTTVKLNDGRVGEIIFFERDHPTRPWISIQNTIVNLTVEHNLHITEIIQ
jgi:HD-GYP domain-containing protein (c-di-GMP phosphodiesterase class II)